MSTNKISLFSRKRQVRAVVIRSWLFLAESLFVQRLLSKWYYSFPRLLSKVGFPNMFCSKYTYNSKRFSVVCSPPLKSEDLFTSNEEVVRRTIFWWTIFALLTLHFDWSCHVMSRSVFKGFLNIVKVSFYRWFHRQRFGFFSPFEGRGKSVLKEVSSPAAILDVLWCFRHLGFNVHSLWPTPAIFVREYLKIIYFSIFFTFKFDSFFLNLD